ncbi:MAG: hypothetical protein D6766_10575 [Verrucomicrobia bacterium]|nr:MAG: hypothetical protein D6766_10575 [Verrucomicrobiota bacterium]
MSKRWFLWCWLPVLAGCANPTGTGFSSGAEPDSPGHRLYVQKCASCHRFYHPANYTGERWQYWMDTMAEKARLTPEEKQTLSAYLDQFRRDPERPTPR